MWLLGSVVVPDTYARLVSAATSRSHYWRLKRAIRRGTGIRTGLGYRRWLRREQTWRDLVARQHDAYERLIESLMAEEAKGLIRRRPENRERAALLVDATIGHFLPTLDPSLAIAVADYRADRRHDEVIARLDAGTSFVQRLEMIPPAAREVLEQEHDERGRAERLVDAVVRSDPRNVVESLIRSPPDWLDAAPAVIHLALAQMAQSYGLRLEAAREFERTADLGMDRPLLYARAAFDYAAAEQPKRAEELISKARSAGGHPQLDLIEAAIQEDPSRILAAMDSEAAAEEPFIAQIYALALQQVGEDEGAISLLENVVEAFPQYTGIALHLARLLLKRSRRPGTTSRSHDLNAALTLSEQARDERRKWRGDSREAVDLACQAALVAGDYRHAIQLGTPQPDGLALPDEAAEPEVQFSVAQAAIAIGDLDTVREVAAAAAGFHQSLILADLLAASKADQTEINEQFERAWDLAETEENKVALWLSASMAGVEPLSGQDELDQRTDDLPLLALASQHIARGRLTEAIELLRPNRQSESIRRLLTNAYLRNDQIDEAIAELVDIAQRFDNADHLVGAVEILAGADRLTEAAELADRTLPMIQPGRFERNFLHEVGVAAAHNRNDWTDMETRVRAWINESGTDSRRRWLLVSSLFNQADPDAAWQVWQEGGGVEPETGVEAQMWIALHSRYRPSPDTLANILAMSERFPDDPDVRASAVNAFFLMGDSKGEINPDDLARWHELIRQRAETPAPEDTFMSISMPNDLDGLIETFRPMLEPQAHQIDTWLSKVRKEGWPYGMLAAAAGRTYTTAIVQRAAGFLPVASPHREVADLEVETALEALSGPVVVDISAVATAWYIKEFWTQFLAVFTRVGITAESKRDSAIAADSVRPRSSGTLGWDISTGRPVFHDADPEELDRLEAHLSWVYEQVATLSLAATPQKGDDHVIDLGAWMTSFTAARAEGVPLWADDVGLRTLARNEGVSTFGTDALIRALESKGRLTPEDAATLIETLRNEYCVDFPVDRLWLLESARRDDWGPGPALFTFTRPSSWAADLHTGYEVWREVADNAGASDPMKVVPWVYAASAGLIGAIPPARSLQLVAGIIVSAMNATRSDPTAFAACVAAARDALRAEELPDPVDLALEMAFDLLSQRVGQTQAATAMARLGAELTDDHRQALRRLLFDI